MRSPTSFLIKAAVVFCIAFAAYTLAADAPRTPVRKAMKPGALRPHNESELLAYQLDDPDDAVRAKALARARELAEDGVLVEDAWLATMLRRGQFEDVDSLAAQGIVNWPEFTPQIAAMQKQRAIALREAEKPEAALEAAKGYYNVSEMKGTEDAIGVIIDCLQDARPDDTSVVKRFKAQQVAWATASTLPAANGDLGENVLKSIQVDGKAFEEAAAQIKTHDFQSMIGRGNLFLLADKPAEAHKLFEASVNLAKTPDQATLAIEGVARAIRAENGCIGPANAYITSQQQTK